MVYAMVEPAFLAVTRTPSSGPCAEVTCPDSAWACTWTAPGPAVNSATARPTAVDSKRCSLRILISPIVVVTDSRRCRLLSAFTPGPEFSGAPEQADILPAQCAPFRLADP